MFIPLLYTGISFSFQGLLFLSSLMCIPHVCVWRTEPNTWYTEIESPNPYTTRPDRFFTLCSSRIERECSSLWGTSGWIHVDSNLIHPCFPEPITCSCLCNSSEVLCYGTVLSLLSYRNYEGKYNSIFHFV